MWSRLVYFRCLHFHVIAQGITFQFKGARRGNHTRIITQGFAHKMDSEHVIKCFDRAHQYLTATANLDVDQLQAIVFEDADEATLPMRLEILSLSIV